MTNFQVMLFLEKTQNLRVESKTVTTREKNCHEKLLGRVHLCRRISTVPTVVENQTTPKLKPIKLF